MSKVLSLIASIFITFGLVIFIGAMTALGWDFEKLSTVSYETSTYSITEDFDKIYIDGSIHDIDFKFTEDNSCSIFCDESENIECSAAVKDGTLYIDITEDRKWYEFINISFKSPKLTLCLPKGTYDTLTIDAATGDVNISDMSFNFIDIECTTGDIDITDVSCLNVDIDVTTGDITLNNVIASEKFSIECTTGDVEFKNSDATDIIVNTTTGDVSGTLLSEKVFITDTTTGDIDVPESISGGKCRINTTTGDIEINISSK